MSVPASVSERSLWSQDSRSPTTAPISFTVTENGAFVPTAPWSGGEDPFASSFIVFSTAAESKAKAACALEVLREESEVDAEQPEPQTSVPSAPPPENTPACTTPTGPPASPAPPRRQRNLSCPDPGFRNGQVWLQRTPRPPSVVSETSLASPTSATSSEQSDRWEDAHDDFPSDAELGDLPISIARRASVQHGDPSRPFTMYSTFSTFSEQDSYFDEFGFSEGWAADEVHGYTSDGSVVAPKRTRVRESVATMNSVMTNSSVDAVLPRHGFCPPERSPERPHSPAPSSSGSSSSGQTHVRSSSPASSTPSLHTPSVEVKRSASKGSRKYRVSVAVPDSPLLTPSEEGQWCGEGQDEDLIDSYFYDADLPQHGSETPHRERVSQRVSAMATPAHFPKPYQHRPPGQFHLPWSPAPTRCPSSASTIATPASPTASVTSAGGEHFTVKAVRQDSIVLLRAAHGEPLAHVRTRLREKFATQEGVRLTDAFTLGFNPAVTGSGRPRSHSAASSLDARPQQPRLRFITNDEDWEKAVASCTGKLTIHVFDRF